MTTRPPNSHPIARARPEANARESSPRGERGISAGRDPRMAHASVCSYCGVGCPYTVEPGPRGEPRVVPLSELGLCVKGKTSLITGGHAERSARLASRGLPDDRIRSPMIRGHDGVMKAVSWDEALDRAAWLMLHAREWVGPDALAIYGNGQATLESIWVASLYKLVFRMPTVGANSEHCLASAGSAHVLNFGNEASFTWQGFDELSRCDVAVLHGTNAFVTFPQAYEKLARNERALKVVIDPVESDTVTELRAIDPRVLHIRFRPGGDVRFNLAVTRIIFERGWEDRAFLDRTVDPASVAALRRQCRHDDYRPGAVARRIALPGQDPSALAATIERYAALVAQPRPDGQRPRVAFVSSMGVNQSTGSYGFSTNLNLLLLTHNVGRPGAGSLRIAGQSNATSELMLGFNAQHLPFNLDPARPEHRRMLARALDLPESNIPDAAGTPVARMSEDDRLYGLLFIGTHMTRNMPRLGHWQRRMGRSFNVVIDAFLGEGVLEYADVLLPSLTHTERQGVIQRGDRTLQLQQRVSEPPPQARSDEQILVNLALAIARRLRDPDTAAINAVDPEVVHRTFARYLDADGHVDTSAIFDHLVETSRTLDLYCRLEDGQGRPLSHDMLREHAGRGVQWGGDGRYVQDIREGRGFPGVLRSLRGRARLVSPPESFVDRLDKPLPPRTVLLVSGRGRPGHRARFGRGRYNSGIKTRPITGRAELGYAVAVSRETVASLGLTRGELVRLTGSRGAIIARLETNERVPPGVASMDFVPGQLNRLTDYAEADRFTGQSLIKRTPVHLGPLRPLEAALWAEPRAADLDAIIEILFDDYRRVFPSDEDWLETQRGQSDPTDPTDPTRWLPARVLQRPRDEPEQRVSEAAGAVLAFLQREREDPGYRRLAARELRALAEPSRDRLLCILLPLLRRLDQSSAMHRILASLVGGVRLVDDRGRERTVDLLSAHRCAILEFKEEIVAAQLYVAIKRALEQLFGPDPVVRRSDLAFVSGVAIPCAGDVPAHFLGISPAELDARTLIHSRAIGNSALIVVDRRTDRAVRIDIRTGVLPRDRELTALRGSVINKKRSATGAQHRRFFDRLGELIVDYVRRGDENFSVHGPVPLPWGEYRDKLAFAPPVRRRFVDFMVRQRVSPALVDALAWLGALGTEDPAAIVARMSGPGAQTEARAGACPSAASPDELYAGTLRERVHRVVETIIAPVLANDGGRLDILNIDDDGEIELRLVGNCANCPYSLLSMEQLVVPNLRRIPGVTRVRHRARLRDGELRAIGRRRPSLPVLGSRAAD